MAKLILRFGLDTMVPSAKDDLIAPKISTLSEPNIPTICSEKNILAQFIFNLGLSMAVSNMHRQLLFNFIRKAEDARAEYERGTDSVRRYLEGHGLSLRPYFSALRSFEHCIAHLYQSVCCMNGLSQTLGGTKQFDRDDGSVLERVYLMHSEIKHMDERFTRSDCAKEMSFVLFSRKQSAGIPSEHRISNIPMWLTNEGLECSKAKISFAELCNEINELLAEAERLATSQANSPSM